MPEYRPRYASYADEDEPPEGLSSFIQRITNWMAVENACRVIDRYVFEESQPPTATSQQVGDAS